MTDLPPDWVPDVLPVPEEVSQRLAYAEQHVRRDEDQLRRMLEAKRIRRRERLARRMRREAARYSQLLKGREPEPPYRPSFVERHPILSILGVAAAAWLSVSLLARLVQYALGWPVSP